MIRQRLFCLGIGMLVAGTCSPHAGSLRTPRPASTLRAPARLAALDVPTLTRLIAAALPQGQEIARGRYLYHGRRETDTFDAPTLAYHLFVTDELAGRCHADFAAKYLPDRCPPLAVPTGSPYPALQLDSDERGMAVVQIETGRALGGSEQSGKVARCT